ncbi:MAG: aminotransferase class IV [Planctomycetes bacterium]|nr:aminotransferase class IV [Planctomycetota bacterium]
MLNDIVWHNGEFLARNEAAIAIDDGGWLHGAGLFETMRAENGRIFRLHSHLERLCRSAQVLLRPIPHDELPTREIFEELLARNELKAARIRLTVSAGSMIGDSEKDEQPITVYITASPMASHAAHTHENGVPVVITQHRVSPTDPIAPHKTIAYLPRLIGLREAHRAQCVEALWFTTGSHLAEGSISNVFIVKGGILKTPPLATPVLPGVTRATVLELARQLEIDTQEFPLSIDDLLDADEVFLTNIIMQIVPVIRVEKHDIADGRVGVLTTKLREAFRELVRKECGNE